MADSYPRQAPIVTDTTGKHIFLTSKTAGPEGNIDPANLPVSDATQTALDGKAASDNPTFTGTVTAENLDVPGVTNLAHTPDKTKGVSVTATNEAPSILVKDGTSTSGLSAGSLLVGNAAITEAILISRSGPTELAIRDVSQQAADLVLKNLNSLGMVSSPKVEAYKTASDIAARLEPGQLTLISHDGGTLGFTVLDDETIVLGYTEDADPDPAGGTDPESAASGRLYLSELLVTDTSTFKNTITCTDLVLSNFAFRVIDNGYRSDFNSRYLSFQIDGGGEEAFLNHTGPGAFAIGSTSSDSVGSLSLKDLTAGGDANIGGKLTSGSLETGNVDLTTVNAEVVNCDQLNALGENTLGTDGAGGTIQSRVGTDGMFLFVFRVTGESSLFDSLGARFSNPSGSGWAGFQRLDDKKIGFGSGIEGDPSDGTIELAQVNASTGITVDSDPVAPFVELTQAEYDALGAGRPSKFYIITDA